MKYSNLILSVLLLLSCNARLSFAADEIPVTREQITLSYAPVVKRVVPAVVNIFTRHTEKVMQSPLLADPLFSQFFGRGMGGVPKERVVQSLGSGVIVGADGTIVTSYHVVKGSDQITVVLSDRRELGAHIEKIDERSDLAVLKVDAKATFAPLPTLELRDSDTLEVGDLVLAVGNPFGVGQTVTSGIISALARSASDVSDYQFFIQTDAAINPGNSGGALVDMQGRLIGINTAIYTQTGGYQGIGFAIPANMVSAVLKSHAGKAGNVIEPYFGVAVQPVTREVADAESLDRIRGVLVQAVAPKSPAEKAGIKPGDIILKLGASDVDDAQSLNFRIATTGMDAASTVTLWREGHELTVPVAFTAPPAAIEGEKITLKGNHPLNGVTVTMLTSAMANGLHLKSAEPRVIVLAGGNDQSMGMNAEAGDIIISVNDKQIHSISDLQHVLGGQSHSFKMMLVRGGMVLTMSVQQ